MHSWEKHAAYLHQHGLYDPRDEHDNCGIGVVAKIKGKANREIVEMAIGALKSVWHRGAVNADGKTGDGAGIHIEIPDAFFKDCIARYHRTLPDGTHFAVGMLFLPGQNFQAQEQCRAAVETEILRLGYPVLGWRKVPINESVIGREALASCPEIMQIILAGKNKENKAEFERNLYLARRRIERAVKEKGISQFYINSLSCRSIIYKGLFKAEDLDAFYLDLKDRRFISRFAIFHQRFSTNTAPQWHLAQPFRILAHNGEINTLRGNVNWMKSHEATMASPLFGNDIHDLKDVVPAAGSDTSALDAVMELFVRAGRPLPLAKIIMMPPAWSHDSTIPTLEKALYSYSNCIMAPWDGPAAIVGTDGEWVIAGMDRNGLRPLRYTITRDDTLVVGSETGMVPVDPVNVLKKGRVGPGQLIGVHLTKQEFFSDSAIKHSLSTRKPYTSWVKKIKTLPKVPLSNLHLKDKQILKDLEARKYSAAITTEDMELILEPMVLEGKEGVGSMGDDLALAVLSKRYRGMHHFFRQNFSQVTNPPIDSLREKGVMSLYTRLGNKENILNESSSQTRHVLLETPILMNAELRELLELLRPHTYHLPATFAVKDGVEGLEKALKDMVLDADNAFKKGKYYFVISDEGVNATRCHIPSILAVAALHTHAINQAYRKQISIIIRSSECLDTHHVAVLLGVGATVVNPYLAEMSIRERHARNLFGDLPLEKCLMNYQKAASEGVLKIMSKMGISVVSSYRGSQNFEALGLSRALVSQYFPGLNSRISGIGITGIAKHLLTLHHEAWHSNPTSNLPIGGIYRLRSKGETHAYGGAMVHTLQRAVIEGDGDLYKKYTELAYNSPAVNLRDLLEFRYTKAPIPVEEVESVKTIVQRFVAPAMSLGALSPEAHETLAIAMNRIGAASNSGEGGEGKERYHPRANGENANSVIKQVASGRFGVTTEYLNHCREIQIKIAQGAKPGEGGQLPGFKVTAEIARLRHATPGVMLISPPPHHDIYSIEDLAQLIYDLKQVNPAALISVKLVAQSGIGTIASGVAKAMADKILIAGHAGGTGASPYSSIRYTGIPWEMGLAEANQVLTLNGLRHRVRLQTDGGIKTGRDVVIAALLGAEEYGIGTLSLVALGCILVRQCHTNKCPVGITTQDPELRKKYEGNAERVVNLFKFIAEEIREILASLGVRSLEEAVGHSEWLRQTSRGDTELNLDTLDLTPLLIKPGYGNSARTYQIKGRNEVADSLDEKIINEVREAVGNKAPLMLSYPVYNTQRSIGTRLSSMIVREFPDEKLEKDLICLRLVGSAGQSLGAFLKEGIKLEIIGDANDYVGKGLSGGTITVRPPLLKEGTKTVVPHHNSIIGNTSLYGATSGLLLASGLAGERFAVRNSGAEAVIEGCGSNGCEYMTGGMVVVLGKVSNNFAAGMTGGMAFVYDETREFEKRINAESVIYQRVASKFWENELKRLISLHVRETDSDIAKMLLSDWQQSLSHFWQIVPKEMLSRLTNPLEDAPQKAMIKRANSR